MYDLQPKPRPPTRAPTARQRQKVGRVSDPSTNETALPFAPFRLKQRLRSNTPSNLTVNQQEEVNLLFFTFFLPINL